MTSYWNTTFFSVLHPCNAKETALKQYIYILPTKSLICSYTE